MLSTRRLWWAALALTALTTGCTQEPAAPPTETPAVNATPAAPTTPPPTTPAASAKDGMKAEMPGEAAPAGKAEMPNDIKIEAPTVAPAGKGEAPKSAAAAAADDSKLSDAEVAEIKKLPADEQAVALKQLVCPVSGEHLGSMEAPVKVSAEGKTFYLCCANCKKSVEKDPKGVVAKLSDK